MFLCGKNRCPIKIWTNQNLLRVATTVRFRSTPRIPVGEGLAPPETVPSPPGKIVQVVFDRNMVYTHWHHNKGKNGRGKPLPYDGYGSILKFVRQNPICEIRTTPGLSSKKPTSSVGFSLSKYFQIHPRRFRPAFESRHGWIRAPHSVQNFPCAGVPHFGQNRPLFVGGMMPPERPMFIGTAAPG